MASFRCYDNSNVIVTLIITNFHLYQYSCGGNFSKSLLMADIIILCSNMGGILTLNNPIESPNVTKTNDEH